MLTVYYGNNRDKVLEAYREASKIAVPIPNTANLEEYANHKSMFDENENFVILLQELTKEEEVQLKKQGAELKEFNFSKQEEERKKKEETNERNKIYRISDALGRRNKKELWLEYWRAIMREVKAEEVFWKLNWQTRNMLLAISTKDAKEAGISEYPYSKAKESARNYTHDELVAMSSKLLDLWSDTHTKSLDLTLTLEQFILSV